MRPPDDGSPIAVAIGVTRRFVNQGETVLGLDDVSMVARAGALTAVVGPSGSGKSTLLGQLACIDRPTEGTVALAGVDVTSMTRRARRRLRRTRLGIVLPQPSDNLFDHLDAADNLRWAARTRGAEPLSRDDAVAQLDRVGLAAASAKRVVELSGGEQQRLAVLCAAVGDPLLVLADEPTASLDRVTAAQLVDVLRAFADAGTTIGVATHDPALVDAADDVVRLDHGRLA